MFDTENGIKYVKKAENTEPTARNTAKGFNVVYSFLKITSISIKLVFIFMSGYGQWKDRPTISRALTKSHFSVPIAVIEYGLSVRFSKFLRS